MVSRCFSCVASATWKRLGSTLTPAPLQVLIVIELLGHAVLGKPRAPVSSTKGTSKRSRSVTRARGVGGEASAPYRLNDGIMSIVSGSFQQLVGVGFDLLGLAFEVVAYQFVYDHLRLREVDSKEVRKARG